MTVPPPSEGQAGPLFRFSTLTQGDRTDIVNRAGSQGTGTGFVSSRALVLSALGATLDLDGSWPAIPEPPGGDNLAEWRQVTTQGRDQYVRIVDYGYLLPFGLRAALVTISDRVFAADPVNSQSYADAYLQYESFVRVLEPLKTFPALGQPFSSLSFPFTSVQVLTLISPLIDPTSHDTLGGTVAGKNPYPQAFFPTTNGGDDIYWNIRLVDGAGTVVTTRMPMAFLFGQDVSSGYTVSQFDLPGSTSMVDVINAYNALGQTSNPSSRVTAAVPGIPIRYAPEVTTSGTAHPGLTTHPTLQLVFGIASPTSVPVRPLPSGSSATSVSTSATASPTSLESANQPAAYPSLLSAQVRLPAAEALSRSSFDDGSGPGGVAIGYYGNYLQGGFPASLKPAGASDHGFRPDTSNIPNVPSNLGSIYAGLINNPQLNFPSDAVGGLTNPNLLVSGLSAAAGAIGGALDTYAQKALAFVEDYFSGLSSELSNFLGGLPLAGLGGAVPKGVPPEGPSSPLGILGDFVNDLGVPGITQQVEADGTRVVTYTQQASLQDFPGSNPVFQPDDGSQLSLTATVTIAPTGTTTYKVTGTMGAFTITVLGSGESLDLIEIPFGNSDQGQPAFTFSAQSGAKTSFVPNIGQPTFQGVLTFVNTLEQFLENLGGSGFSIDVTPSQVSLSLSLNLPSIGVGVFSLENLGLSAGVVVPFLGGATVATFSFCSAEQPFTLTVCCFGGGGYISLGVGLTSIQSLTASLDFEGQFGLDLGVASGSVSLVAGVTFSYAVAGGASLTAFVRITGEVEVLGILSITLELDLSLTYDFSTNVLTGTATMTVSVSIAFFSVSVGITVQKSFGGGGTSGSSLHGASDPELAAVTTYAPTFANQMSSSDWTTYCDAFAG
jgi:hypothetical protein